MQSFYSKPGGYHAMQFSSSTGGLSAGFLCVLESSFDGLHVWNLARDNLLLDVGPFLHVLLVLDPRHDCNHQLLQVILLVGHVLGRLHHLDRMDPGVNLVQRLVERSLCLGPLVHVGQSNSMPVVGLGNGPRSRRKSSNPLGKTVLEVGNSLLVVVTLHALLSQEVKSFTCQVHLASLGPDHSGHLQHLPSMLQMESSSLPSSSEDSSGPSSSLSMMPS